jgi:hypothetical protein
MGTYTPIALKQKLTSKYNAALYTGPKILNF